MAPLQTHVIHRKIEGPDLTMELKMIGRRPTKEVATRTGSHVDVTYVSSGQFQKMGKTETPSTPALEQMFASTRARSSSR